MSNKIKKYTFILLVVILALPAIQQNFSIFNNGRLGGYFSAAPDVPFSFEHWWDGKFEEEKSAFCNDNVGFRPAFVRVKNQLDYSLFDKLHGDWLAPGKEHYLLQTVHINACYGRDFAGYNAIYEKLRKWKAVEDTLQAMGKTVVIIHAPNKAYFYPEYIPDQFKFPCKTTTNLATFLRIGDSLGIHQIDFNAWFATLKNKSTEPLYTKQGIHWSVYGSLIAADSFVKYIEKQRNILMPRPQWNNIIHTIQPRETDDDLAQTLNLVFPYTREIYSYPQVYYQCDGRCARPSVIYIGDSFLFNWINDGLMQHTNLNWQVWEHFNIIWDSSSKDAQIHNKLEGYDWISAIKNTDCIVLMYTSFNLNELGSGFIEKSYSYFYPEKK